MLIDHEQQDTPQPGDRPARLLLLHHSGAAWPRLRELLQVDVTGGQLDIAVGMTAVRARVEGGEVDCVLVILEMSDSQADTPALSLVRAIRALPGHVPVVVLADSLSQAGLGQLLAAGASDVIARQVASSAALARTVRHAVHLYRAEADFFAAERRLRERLDFERQLIGIVSHDLRNPVNAMTLAASSALRHLDSAEQVRTKLTRIRLSGERAIKLIGDFLDLTQVHLGKGIPVSYHPACLARVASQVVDEIRQVHPQRTIVLVGRDDTLGDFDADRMAQVIGNLLGNALAYSPADTPVTLTLGGDAQVFALTVHNFGEPIPPGLQATLFEPLKRGRHDGNSGRSIGMGLFIVAEIVRAHQGSVRVESASPTGTSFTVSLARRRGPAGQRPPAPPTG